MLALRCVADALAALLLLRCYPTGRVASAALVVKLLFAAHVLFAAWAYGRYRRGAFTERFIAGDVLASTGVMLLAAHYAEGVYSPILYLLLVEIAGFVIIFGPRAGRLAALVAGGGVVVQAAADALGLWPVGGVVSTPAWPRLLDFATMLGANAVLLIGVTRTMRWARAKEQHLAAAAVERVGLIDRLREEAHRVGALLRVSQEIGIGGTFRDLDENVCRLARELVAADEVALRRAGDGGEAVVTPGGDGEGRLVVAPLSHAGRVYGYLAARRTITPGRFDAPQVALLEGIARQAGMALDNLRLLEEERSAASLATTLLAAAREFGLALDLPTLLARLGAHATDLTGATAAVVALWHPREHVYRVEAVHGGQDGSGLQGVDLGAQALRGRGDRLHLDAAWRDRFRSALGLDPAATEVSLAIERGGETAGVLTLLWPVATEPAAAEIGLARGLVNQAAIALQNVRLLDDVREASRLKSEFVATMSHELRTPLNVILGYLNLFLEDAIGPLDGEQRGILVRMQRSARELFDLVSATLDLNRLEAGKSRVTVEPVVVPDLFAQLEAETVSGLEREAVQVYWQLASDLPALETDRAKLRIVLKNLIGNAIKFTERGNVTVAAERSADAVVFTVSDTGTGIRREDLPVIFEMFRQAECANTRRHGGVGLGLYIVKRLLAELRAEIEVESELGAGSRFRVRVPLRLPARAVTGGPRG
jgi:signal transduction histidine kinase